MQATPQGIGVALADLRQAQRTGSGLCDARRTDVVLPDYRGITLARVAAVAASGQVYYYGFAPGGMIHRLGAHIGKQYGVGACLVTVVDSSDQPAASFPELFQQCPPAACGGPQVDFIHGHVLVAGPALRWLFAVPSLFHGFDEIYLFDEKPALAASPRGYYTCDGYQFVDSVPEELISYMDSTRAALFLADGTGIGMNYVMRQDVASTELGKELRAL